jgi:hypothetical protein
MKAYFETIKFVAAIGLLLLTTACNDEQPAKTEQLSSSKSVQGGVTKGVLVGATVNAYPIAIDGTVDLDNLVASATTNAQGLFSLEIATNNQYLWLQSSGGEFIDETDQNPVVSQRRKISFSAEQGLIAVLPPGYSQIAITMTTQALYEKTLAEFSNDFYSVYQVNIQNFTAGLGFNPLNTLSADPNNPDPAAEEAARQYALLSGGLANLTNQAAIAAGYPSASFELVMALVDDFSDGMIDGLLNGEPIIITAADGSTTSLVTELDLDSAINRFRNNNYQSYQTTSLPVVDQTLTASTGQLNTPPSVTINGPTSVAANTGVSLLANAIDDDGTVQSYLWQQTSGTPITLRGVNSATLDFTAPTLAVATSASFSVTVTDDSALSTVVSHDIDFEVADALVINAGNDQSIASDSVVSLNGTQSSVSGVTTANVQWNQVSGTPVSLTNSNSLTGVSFTAPRVALDTVLVFELTVTDSLGRIVSDSVAITILEYINIAPSVNAGNDFSADEQVLINLSGSASDSDGTVNSILWQQIAGSNVVINNANTLTPNFIAPALTSDEILVLSLTVTDDDGASSSDNISITIIANVAPVVNAGSDQTVNENTTVNLAGTVTDNDGTITSTVWSQTSGTAVVFDDSAILTPSFMAPDLVSDEVLTFSLTATDNDGDTSSDTLSITVMGNISPVVDAGVDQTVDEQTLVNLSGTASDSDGTVDSILWQQIAGTTVVINNANTLTANFTAPALTSDELLVFNLTVTDDFGESVTDSVSINIIANVAPVVNAGSDQTVNENTTVNLAGTVTDNDGTITSTVWSQTSGTAVVFDDSAILTPSFMAPDLVSDEVLTFSLTATDNDGDTSSDTLSITVMGNISPVVDAGVDQTVDEQTLVNLSGTASDSDGVISSQTWSQIQGTSVTLSNNNSLTPSFFAPDISVDETLIFQLTVTDDFGESVVDSISIDIIANLPVVLSPTNDFTIDEAQSVTVAANAVDPESGIVDIKWTQITGVAVRAGDLTQDAITFSTPDVTITEELQFQVEAIDDIGNLSTAIVTITVDPVANSAPSISTESFYGYSNNEAVNIFAFANDFDGTIASYLWQQTSGLSLSLSGTTTDTLSFTAPSPTVPELLTFSITVTDDFGSQNIEHISVIIEPNPVVISSLAFTDTNLANCITSYAIERATFVHELFDLICDNEAILDLSDIEQLTYLKKISLVGNSISDVSPLGGLFDLISMDLSQNPIANHIAITQPYLTDLRINDTGLIDLSFIDNLPHLVELSVAANASLTDISPLNAKPGLQILNISDTAINDISFVTNFAALHGFQMNNLGLADLSAIASLSQLIDLAFVGNSVIDTSMLNNLSKLQLLDGASNNMADISVMSNFNQIVSLILTDNQITDLSSLFSLVSLQFLDLLGNTAIDCNQLNSLQSTLSATTVIRPLHCGNPP